MSLLSPSFLAIVLASAVAFHALRGPLRGLAFLGLSAWYAQSFLTPVGAVFTAALCLGGWALAQWVHGRPGRKVPAVAALVGVFVYARGYSFLELLLPADWRTQALATAGLSFLLFKIVHVVIDRADGRIERLPLLEYLDYCLAFTTFLLGPIQRFQDFSDQWHGRTASIEPGFEAHLDAANRMLRGFVKKFVVAEYLSSWALSPEADVAAMEWPRLVLAVYAFYAFLYFDFSGYCDVVIGAGQLVGVRPPENFDLPFLSPNASQFWLRVHRSLTTWLTDYVFNPLLVALLRSPRLGGRALASACLALMVTMLVSGLWHGTTFNFVLFGLVHGVFLVAFRVYEHVLRRRLGPKGLKAWRATRTSRALGTALTLVTTGGAYVFFVLDSEALLVLLGRIVP